MEGLSTSHIEDEVIKDPLEGKLLSFETNETELTKKRSANVEIENVTNLLYQGNEGQAGYARRVVEVDARVVSENGDRSPSHRFVLKELKDYGDTENLLQRHGELVAAGLPTWSTLRINTENKIALMTSGNQDGDTAIMPNNINNSTVAKLAESNGIKIENYKKMIESMCDTAIRGGSKGIQIGDDVWTYFFNNDAVAEGRPFEIKYLLGDLDEIFHTPGEKLDQMDEYSLKFKNRKKNSRHQLGRINLDNLKVSFDHFSKYISQEDRGAFLEYTESYITQLKGSLTD